MAEKKIPVVILGAGGYAVMVHEILSAYPDYLVLGCTDKALGLSERSLGEGKSLRVLGDDDILPELAEQHPGLKGVLALGPELMDVRARLVCTLDRVGISPVTVVHPRSIVSKLAELGGGTVVSGGAIINAGTQTGPYCALAAGAVIDHDTQLGTNVFVGQGAHVSSYVRLQDNVAIELGACVNSRVCVGEGARVAGGAFVNTDVPDHAVVMGVPARVVRYVDA
jgi:sugar O-acyltransferase (sialic acid O-acetyltransferase NeuD family)